MPQMAMITPIARDAATSGRQIIGPLTTAFEMPPICSTASLSDKQVVDGSLYVLANYYTKPRCEDDGQSHSPCFPHITAWTDLNAGYFYSPGTQCPSDWVTATTVKSGDGGGTAASYHNGVLMNTFLPDETAAICCPSDFTYTTAEYTSGTATLQSGQCARTITTQEWYHSCATQGYVPILVTSVGDPTVGLVDSAGTRTSGTVPFGGMIASAPTLQLNFRPRDVGTTTATATGSSSSASAATDTAGKSSSSGIGGGAIAGIVIGIVALLAGIGALFFFLGRRRRRRRDSAADKDKNNEKAASAERGLSRDGGSPVSGLNTGANGGFEKAELAGSVAQTHTELGAHPSQLHPVELEGDGTRLTQYAELDSQNRSQELR